MLVNQQVFIIPILLNELSTCILFQLLIRILDVECFLNSDKYIMNKVITLKRLILRKNLKSTITQTKETKQRSVVSNIIKETRTFVRTKISHKSISHSANCILLDTFTIRSSQNVFESFEKFMTFKSFSLPITIIVLKNFKDLIKRHSA